MTQIDSHEMGTPIAEGESSDWNYNPAIPIPTSPLFAWPPRPIAAVKWIASYWVAISSNVIELLLALAVYFWLLPDWDTMSTLSLAWMLQLLAINMVLTLLVAGTLHLYFYKYAVQGKTLKFDARPQMTDNGTYTFRDQVKDNMFWSLASGVPIWTTYLILYFFLASNDWLPMLNLQDHPIWFFAWFLIIPIFSSGHFYWVHRLLHWPPMYNLAHSLHHRNVNIGPWSGLSMHPVEHLIYFSSVLVHFVMASHPIHVLYHLSMVALNPLVSHAGFDGLARKNKKAMGLGDFFHQLHHRYFECNYGTAEMPWDKWFGTFHDGTNEATKRTRSRKSQMMKRWKK